MGIGMPIILCWKLFTLERQILGHTGAAKEKSSSPHALSDLLHSQPGGTPASSEEQFSDQRSSI